jgi:hypothetical protein
MSRSGIVLIISAVSFVALSAILIITKTIDVGLFDSRFAEENLGELMSDIRGKGGVGVTFSGADMPNWALGPGHQLDRFSISNSNVVFARLKSSQRLDVASVDWGTSSASFTLSAEFAQRSNGKVIEVGIIARTAQANGAPALAVAYATQQAGNSGWRSLELDPDFRLMKIKYQVPEVPGGYSNLPVIAFHSDPSGSGRAVEILGAYAKLYED